MQVRRRDPARRPGDGPDRSQHPAGNEPASKQREHGHNGEGETRVDQKLVRVDGALCGFDGCYLGELVHSDGQLIPGLCQPVLVLFQLIPGLCQLVLVLSHLLLDLCQQRRR